MVAQILVAKGYPLYYDTFLNEKTRHNYEIDFLNILMFPVYMLFGISENNFRKESSYESAF